MGVEGRKRFYNQTVALGVAWAQAGRDYMQDAFSIILPDHTKDKDSIDYFGVFDGHGPHGEKISRFVALNLNNIVKETYRQPHTKDYAHAIEAGVLIIDDLMRGVPELMDSRGEVLGGSTGCAVWIKDERIFNANVGDSRCIMSYEGKAFDVSKDHKPFNSEEKRRIENAGGHVSRDGRVNSILAVSRTFGDYEFKANRKLRVENQFVSVVPDVRVVEIDNDIDFMVVASDGIWDMMTSQDAIDYIVAKMAQMIPLDKICSDMIEYCTMPLDSSGQGSDNMTIIIAILR